MKVKIIKHVNMIRFEEELNQFLINLNEEDLIQLVHNVAATDGGSIKGFSALILYK